MENMDTLISPIQIKSAHLQNYHQNHHITVNIPQKQHINNQNALQTASTPSPVSNLPIESARMVMIGSIKRKINSEDKFIHLKDDHFTSTSPTKRVAKIKNLVFRPKIQRFISEEKTRVAALEETLMLQRQRRLNKEECIKKLQRLISPSNYKQGNSKKFMRTEDKKTQQNKKFKRIKEKEQISPEKRQIHDKLLQKLREYCESKLSDIPEHLDQISTESMLQQSNRESQISQLYGLNMGQQLLEQQVGSIKSPFSKK